MKRFKFFDIYQIIITVIFGTGIIGSSISNVAAAVYIFMHTTFDEFNNPVTPESIPTAYSIAYTFFLLIAVLGGTWFFIRLITFKSRKKEYLKDETI